MFPGGKPVPIARQQTPQCQATNRNTQLSDPTSAFYELFPQNSSLAEDMQRLFRRSLRKTNRQHSASFSGAALDDPFLATSFGQTSISIPLVDSLPVDVSCPDSEIPLAPPSLASSPGGSYNHSAEASSLDPALASTCRVSPVRGAPPPVSPSIPIPTEHVMWPRGSEFGSCYPPVSAYMSEPPSYLRPFPPRRYRDEPFWTPAQSSGPCPNDIHAASSELDMYPTNEPSPPMRLRLPPSHFLSPAEAIPLPSGRRSSSRTTQECVFCKNNQEQESYYRSHTLKDQHGRVICPVLRAYCCPICHNNGGDNAHTIKYCPLNKSCEIVSTISALKTARTSTGKRKQIAPSKA